MEPTELLLLEENSIKKVLISDFTHTNKYCNNNNYISEVHLKKFESNLKTS